MIFRKAPLSIFSFLTLIVLVLFSTHTATADTSNVNLPKVAKIIREKGEETEIGNEVTVGLGKTITIVKQNTKDQTNLFQTH